MAFIEAKNFSYSYPGSKKLALKSVNLSITKGSFVVITGRSGCGKSTLGKALAGFLFQDSEPDFTGEIRVDNVDMSQIPLFQASEKVAYVQQNPEDQFCTLSVADEIAFGLENRRVAADEIDLGIDNALEIVKGKALRNRDLSTLSGGEKQKVAIAAMFALKPDVLILDEPTSNLDPAATQQVFKSLNQLRQQQSLTVIVIEHKLHEMKVFDPDLIVMADGQIIDIQTFAQCQSNLAAQNTPLPKSFSPKTPKQGWHIALSNLSVSIQETSILKNINLKIQSGEFIALMGLNGSGKSTLLETMMGFHQIDSGQRLAFGQNLEKTKISQLIKHIGFLFQNPDHQLFNPTVWEEATMVLNNLAIESDPSFQLAHNWLESCQLASRINDHPQTLSYGEKRRLNLIAILLHQPDLLLIDEFLIGQDDANARIWMQFLQEYARNGHSVVFINHHLDFSCQYCDRLIFMENGQIIFDGPMLPNASELRTLYQIASAKKWGTEDA